MNAELYKELKRKAITLRKEGKVYSEILKEVPVAKSTLSLWLREVGLAFPQVQRITEKKIAGQKKGAEARRTQRIAIQNSIFAQCEKEISYISERELWLICTALYWAEGDKEKECFPGRVMGFSNTDPTMIQIFLKWLLKIVPREDIHFSISIHECYIDQIQRVKEFWAEHTGFSINLFDRVYYKKHNIKTNRKNIGNMYNGVLRVRAKRGGTLTRRFAGWAKAIWKATMK